MYQTAVGEKAAVAFEEKSAREAFPRVFHLWVAKREPYLLHLSFAEEAVDDLDVGTEKGYVWQSFFHSLLGASVHSSSFDIDSNEVDVGK